jgi:hypothetical protein
MGMRDTSRVYVAAWLNFNKVSMLAVSQVVHEDLLQECMTKDTLMNRLKFVLRPVHAHVPFPAKGAPEADTIGTFFRAGKFELRISPYRRWNQVLLCAARPLLKVATTACNEDSWLQGEQCNGLADC